MIRVGFMVYGTINFHLAYIWGLGKKICQLDEFLECIDNLLVCLFLAVGFDRMIRKLTWRETHH